MTTLKTYRAPTMAQALAEVKKDLGAEAVIVNTRSVMTGGWAGLGAKPIVEITASPAAGPAPRAISPRPAAPVKTVVARTTSPAPAGPPRAASPTAAPARTASASPARPAPSQDDWLPLEFGPLLQEAAAARRATTPPVPPPALPAIAPAGPLVEAKPVQPEAVAIAQPASPQPVSVVEGRVEAPAAAETPVIQLSTPPALPPVGGPARLAVKASPAPVSEAARATLEDELASIKRLMGQVLQFSRRAASRGDANAPFAPPVGGVTAVLQEVYTALLDAAIAPETVDRLLAGVQAELSPMELEDPDLVHATATRLLADVIPVVRSLSKPGRQPDGRPLTIALVGPTGVGKTTTIAKLAAMYKLRHGKRVGLVTTDTYRIAAVEQLRTYARIIGLPIKVAADAQELAENLAEMKDMDVVLIDTAGRSPTDHARLDELFANIRAARPHETHLVLAATAAEPVLARTAERFSPLRPDRLLLTKLDEAVQLGVVAAIPARAGLPISYITTGQEVPDDIELASADRLARRILADLPSSLPPDALAEAVGA